MSDPNTFVGELERYARRSFQYAPELALLVGCARSEELLKVLRDAAFRAKFIAKTTEVMERVGPTGEGFQRLSTELESAVGAVRRDLAELLASIPAGARASFESRLLLLGPESFGAFLGFMQELAWLKNWELDGRALPGNEVIGPAPEDPPGPSVRRSDLNHVFRTGVLAILLLLTYILVEPPVSLIGAVLAGLAVVQVGTVVYFTFQWRRSNFTIER